MTIYKAHLTVTFMFDSNIDTPEAVRAMTLGEILNDMEDGHMLGQVSGIGFKPIPNEEVAGEERALGCDGTFFADPDELEHARLDAEGRPDRDCDATCSRRFSPAAECDCSRSQ